jgi:hypothetical protein
MNPEKMKITRESVIEEVIAKYPDTVEVFIAFGMPCFVCGEPAWGTVGELMDRYNVTEPEKVLARLNETARKSDKV